MKDKNIKESAKYDCNRRLYLPALDSVSEKISSDALAFSFLKKMLPSAVFKESSIISKISRMFKGAIVYFDGRIVR